MFDDLRNSAEIQNDFFKNDDAELEPYLAQKPLGKTMGFRFNSNTFLGMNAFQRFVISALLLLMVCVVGTLMLLITGTVVLF